MMREKHEKSRQLASAIEGSKHRDLTQVVDDKNETIKC
jgi:hypothetical protein